MRHAVPLTILLLVPALALPATAQTKAATPPNPAKQALLAEIADTKSPTARTRLLLSRAEDTPGPRTAAVEELLAAQPRIRSRLRSVAANSSRARDRRTALAALLRLGDDRFVCRRAVRDTAPAVRRHVGQRYKELGRTAAAIRGLQRHLTSRDPKYRIRAAQLLVTLDDVRALPVLRSALKKALRRASATRGPKVYVAFMRQQGFVRDFDVEVASSSFIADPKVDVIHEGAVLPVEILASRTTRVYAESIRALNASRKRSQKK